MPDAAVCDFQRSFIRWRHDIARRKMLTASQPPATTLNNVRMPLECFAVVSQGGTNKEFALGASCKAEQVFVQKDVWMQPNADMCAVAGDGKLLIIKRWDRADKGVMLYPPSLGAQPERQCVDALEAFDTQTTVIRRQPARRLEAIEDTLMVLAGDQPIVARTSYRVGDTDVTIEYPVKTVNYSERHRYYQVDTGPVLAFDPPTGPSLIERFHLAFIAHLGGDWAEFLVSQRTPLDNLPVAVHHYSETRRVNAQHSLWVVDN